MEISRVEFYVILQIQIRSIWSLVMSLRQMYLETATIFNFLLKMEKSMQKHSLKNVPLICSVKCSGRTKIPISWLHPVPQGLIWHLVYTGKFAKKVTCHSLQKKHSISSTFYIRKKIIETSNLKWYRNFTW